MKNDYTGSRKGSCMTFGFSSHHVYVLYRCIVWLCMSLAWLFSYLSGNTLLEQRAQAYTVCRWPCKEHHMWSAPILNGSCWTCELYVCICACVCTCMCVCAWFQSCLKAKCPEGGHSETSQGRINNLCLQSLPLCCLSLLQSCHDSRRKAFIHLFFMPPV